MLQIQPLRKDRVVKKGKGAIPSGEVGTVRYFLSLQCGFLLPMKHNPSYYAVITADVRYDQRLSANAKLLYGEITSLTNKEGYCWASNAYFAELYGLTERTISRLISSLKNCGYINYEVEQDNYRKIYLSQPPRVDNSDVGGRQKCRGGTTKMSRGVRQKCLHNTKENTKGNITSNSGEEIDPQDIVDVIDAFAAVNHAFSKWYGNTTQRNAVSRLITLQGKENVLNVVAQLPKTNTMEFMPTITTPLELDDKYAKLQNQIIRQRNRHIQQKPRVI